MVTGRGLMALSHHSTTPVPLFLIPQALSEEIRKYGDNIMDIRIRRTAGHTFIIRIKHEMRGDRGE